MLNTYTTHLEQLGKSSARDVKSILRKYVFNANAALVVRKAAEFSVDDFVGLIGAVVDKGKGRTAGKVRSFLRAAYALAIRSKMDPALPQAMRSFGIVVNPLASTAALSQFNGTRKRHLNALELGEFNTWTNLQRTSRESGCQESTVYQSQNFALSCPIELRTRGSVLANQVNSSASAAELSSGPLWGLMEY